MKVGFVNTFIDIAVLQLAINTWGYYYWELDKFPSWARDKNTTAIPDVFATTLVP